MKVACINIILSVLINFSMEDSELFLSTPEILANRKVTYENHTVTTADGYILTIFRIPRKNPKGIVLLVHSLSVDSSIWLVTAKRSIAMDIFNAGYDIWMPNFRGLSYSDKHVKPYIKKLDYWDFSYHEIGYFDFPAIVNYVKNATNSKVILINHSLSSTAALVYASLRPEEAKNSIKVSINTATSCYMNHTSSPLKYFIPFELLVLKPIFRALNIGAIYSDFKSVIKFLKRMALMFPIRVPAAFFTDLFFGWSGFQMDPEAFPMMFSLTTQPIALKIVYHFSQNILTGKFAMYDHGKMGNIRKYNSVLPPEYPIENIKTPFYLVISTTDSLSDAWGSYKLYDKLPPIAKKYGRMIVTNVNHADYLIGKQRFGEIFDKLIHFINSVS